MQEHVYFWPPHTRALEMGKKLSAWKYANFNSISSRADTIMVIEIYNRKTIINMKLKNQFISMDVLFVY